MSIFKELIKGSQLLKLNFFFPTLFFSIIWTELLEGLFHLLIVVTGKKNHISKNDITPEGQRKMEKQTSTIILSIKIN